MEPPPLEDIIFIRFLPGICMCIVWLYIVLCASSPASPPFVTSALTGCVHSLADHHPQCSFQGEGLRHCFNSLNGTLVGIGDRGELWGEYFDEYYQLTIAMIFGSMLAGATPLGGGVTGFPVAVLAVGLTPDVRRSPARSATLTVHAHSASRRDSQEGRDFAVGIQSVGMNAAAFLIIIVKPHLLDFKFIAMYTVFGTAGVVVGLAAEFSSYSINICYTVSAAQTIELTLRPSACARVVHALASPHRPMLTRCASRLAPRASRLAHAARRTPHAARPSPAHRPWCSSSR